MPATATLLCALLLLACSRPTSTLDELDDGVELPVVNDPWQDTAAFDWRSIGPVAIGPDRRFRPYAELSRKEQRSLDSLAGALRERGVMICY